MSILNRYILKEYLKIFTLSFLGLIVVYLAIEFFGKIRGFIEHSASLTNMLGYFLFRLPRIIFFVSPPALLLSILITFGILCKNNEIIAIESSGISLYRISIPPLLFSFFFSFLLFYLNMKAIPMANEEAGFIREALIEKGSKGAFFKQDRIWFRGDDHSILNIQLIDQDRRIYGVNIYRLDDRFSISETIEARELSFEADRWVLISGIRRRFHEEGRIEVIPFESLGIDLDWRPEELRRVEIDPEDMSYSDLSGYIRRLESGGYSLDRYKVDLHEKISLPFVNFIMAMIGIRFGLRNNRGIGIAKGIGVAMVIGFHYWVVHSIAMSLGHGGAIPPILAAWTANLIFFAVGGYLFLNIRIS